MTHTNRKPIQHFVGGSAWPGAESRSGNVLNPATGAIQATVNLASKADAEHIISSAQAAFPGWSSESPMARARVLYRFRDLVMQEIDALASILSSEHGKTFTDAKGDIQRGLDVVEFACGIPHLLKGESSDLGKSGIDLKSYRVPLGVVAGITPFNFPGMIPMWMFSVAVACGHTFVMKPSEKDPSLPVRLFTKVRTITTRWLEGKSTGAEFSIPTHN